MKMNAKSGITIGLGLGLGLPFMMLFVCFVISTIVTKMNDVKIIRDDRKERLSSISQPLREIEMV